MSYNIGDLVVYGGAEICRICEMVKRNFDGIHEVEYYRLEPQGISSSSYYVPADSIGSRVRHLMTKEEILNIIDNLPETNTELSSNKNERRQMMNDALKSNDYSSLMCMMKSLYDEKLRRSSMGKSLVSSDEKALNAAEKLLHVEFSIVLGIPENKVVDFISERISGK